MTERTAERRRARRSLLAVAAVVILTGILGTTALVRLLLPGDSGRGRTVGSPPTSNSSATREPDVSWQSVAGVDLPFSRVDGPTVTTDGQAAGYSRTGRGAALAAVQVLIRTSATAGPAVFDPVLAAQVTGVNTAAMKLAVNAVYQQLRTQAGVPEGAPIPGPTAHVMGYQVTDLRPTVGEAAVAIYLTSSDLSTGPRYLSFTVQLVWQGEDWRVVAPPGGDWGSVARPLAELPADLRRYGGGR